MGSGSALMCTDEMRELGEACPTDFVPYFTKSSLIVFVVCYLPLMSIAAGLAIPAGLFMPSIVVR